MTSNNLSFIIIYTSVFSIYIYSLLIILLLFLSPMFLLLYVNKRSLFVYFFQLRKQASIHSILYLFIYVFFPNTKHYYCYYDQTTVPPFTDFFFVAFARLFVCLFVSFTTLSHAFLLFVVCLLFRHDHTRLLLLFSFLLFVCIQTRSHIPFIRLCFCHLLLLFVFVCLFSDTTTFGFCYCCCCCCLSL